MRREILLGILHCDLIGFHTYDYARHFLSSCTRILGLPTMPNGAEFEGRYVHVGTYPIGIEPNQFRDGLERESVQTRIKTLERRFEGVKVVVGVDRLDYIKGIPQKLHALETFLQEHPEWIGKVRPRVCSPSAAALMRRTAGCARAGRCAIAAGRGGVPESARHHQRGRRAHQRPFRYRREHADPLLASLGELRGAVRVVCGQRCVPRDEHARRHELGELQRHDAMRSHADSVCRCPTSTLRARASATAS